MSTVGRKKKPVILPPSTSRDLRFDIYVRIYHLFANYINLNCFFVSASNRSDWKPLFYNLRTRQHPTHFESYFGKIKDRLRFNDQCFSRVEKDRRPMVGKHRGFSELYTSVASGGTLHGFLAAGSFMRTPPTEGELSQQWADLSGRGAEPQDSDFLSYARMALDTVVLAPPALEGSKELLEILSNFLCGRADEQMMVRLDEIGKVALSRNLPHFFWMDSMLGLEKFDPRTSLDGTLRDWETKELGITRFPTTVLAVTPQTLTPEKWSALRSMVCSNQLQWEALTVAREFPETVAGKLEDYGALFVTSASPSKSKVQAKLEIRDRAEALHRRLEKKTGMKLLVGIGTTLVAGEQLVGSRQQAVLAMNLCASMGRSVVFYEDLGEKTPVWQGRGLRSTLAQLRKAYRGGSPQERETARAEYVHRVLIYSNGKDESLRAHLLEAFSILVDSLSGCLLQEDELGILADAQEERLLKASSIQEMLSVFHEGLEKIRKVGDKPSEGGRLARMEEVKQYVDRHFTQPLSLGDVADKAGLSKPAFLANFRQATGRGFSQYLQGLRIDEAKRLLRVSPLSIARVGQESGFNSASYFIQAFKRSTGYPPKAFRENERMKPPKKV